MFHTQSTGTVISGRQRKRDSKENINTQKKIQYNRMKAEGPGGRGREGGRGKSPHLSLMAQVPTWAPILIPPFVKTSSKSTTRPATKMLRMHPRKPLNNSWPPESDRNKARPHTGPGR